MKHLKYEYFQNLKIITETNNMIKIQRKVIEELILRNSMISDIIEKDRINEMIKYQ